MLIWLWTFVLLTLSTWRFICATMTSPMPSGRWNIHWTSRVSTARSTTVSCTLIQQKRLERLQVHQTSSLSPSAAQNWHSGCGTVSAQLKQLTLCYLSSSTKSHSQRQPKFPHLYKPTETLTTQVYWTQTGTVSHLLRTNITLMIICSMEKLEGTLRVLSVQARLALYAIFVFPGDIHQIGALSMKKFDRMYRPAKAQDDGCYTTLNTWEMTVQLTYNTKEIRQLRWFSSGLQRWCLHY